VETLSLGIDGTAMCMTEKDGLNWRMAMVGTFSGYGKDTNRLFSIYIGAAPDKGQEQFYDNVSHEWEKLKLKIPNAKTQGLADGAASNWKFLNPRTDEQLLYFYHLSKIRSRCCRCIV
jgi:hypothetical protein